VTVGERESRVREDTLPANGNVDAFQLDVLRFVGAGGAELQRVDGHVKLLVRLRGLGLVEQLGGLVLDRLERLLLLLGGDLALGLFELLAVDLGLDLAGVGGLEINAAGGDGEGRRHVALRADLDGLVQALHRRRTPPLATVGFGVLVDPFLHELLDLVLEGGIHLARSRYEQLGDGGGSFAEGG